MTIRLGVHATIKPSKNKFTALMAAPLRPPGNTKAKPMPKASLQIIDHSVVTFWRDRMPRTALARGDFFAQLRMCRIESKSLKVHFKRDSGFLNLFHGLDDK